MASEGRRQVVFKPRIFQCTYISLQDYAGPSLCVCSSVCVHSVCVYSVCVHVFFLSSFLKQGVVPMPREIYMVGTIAPTLNLAVLMSPFAGK